MVAGVVVLGLIAGLVAIGPVVRGRVAREAARRRLEVTVGSVRPGFFAASLRDVKVRLQGVEGVEVGLDVVRVDLTAGFSLREITAQGGEIRVAGEPDEVVERLRAFQRAGTPSAPSNAKAERADLSASGLALSWKLPSGGELTGTGLTASRHDGVLRLGCGTLSAKTSAHERAVTVALEGGEVELAPGTEAGARRISATSLALGYRVPKSSTTVTSSAVNGVAEPAPPPLPTAAKGRKAKAPGKPPAPAAPAEETRDEPVLPLPDLHALRGKIGALAATLGTRIPDGTRVDVGGLSVDLDVGGDPISFGPGPFTLERRGESLRVAFTSERATAAPPGTPGTPAAKAGAVGPTGTPLTIAIELPLGAGDVTARLEGGPVSLAMLGVKEGSRGLEQVQKGTVSGKGQVVLAAAGDALTFDGQIGLRSIALKQPRLSHEPLRGLDFAVGGRGVLDDQGRLRIDDAQLDMGALHLRAHGTVEETRDHFGVSLSADITQAACQALLDSTPQGLLPTVRSARMSGTFGATARVVFDTRTIDKLVLDYQVDDRCRMIEVPPELSPDRFSRSFTYRTYHPDGKPSETTTGPGTSAWTDLDSISPFMVAAVLTTEDGAFYKHKGFNHAAIRNSVAANLKARRFARGASTITMQLAKNLFLSREKTLSRKIEEVVLTDYLEQAFRKDDMMELYLNVVEFGPDVYGVTRAAEHYFGRKPEELSLPECFFLASLMPAPVRYGKLYDKGQVSEGWMRHLNALMEISAKNGKITRADLEGGTQPIVFHKAGDPRPEPRRPVSAGKRDPYEDDSGWQPLQ